jgi:hypothetical protein
MPYSWGTQWPGVFERHADRCPFQDGGTCTCGPLGYVASIADPDTGDRVASPLLESPVEARSWRREQEWALSPQTVSMNGNGHAPIDDPPRPRARRRPVEPDMPRERPRRQSKRELESDRQARDFESDRPARDFDSDRGPARPRRRDGTGPTVATLIERFLDAAEDGEARDSKDRPYSDDELSELEWALENYVRSHLGDLDAATVRGRHVFRLVDELEDAGMPRSRLRSVVTAVRELFDYGVSLDLIRTNPAGYISLPDDSRPSRRLADTVESRIPGRGPSRAAGAVGGNGVGETMISERAIWMSVKIVTLAFICIALILVAESV